MMKKELLFPSTFLLVTLLHCTTTLAQSSGHKPAPPGPTNISAILEKAGMYTMLIRLLKNTGVGDTINTQLNNSNQGLTVFAPTDNAFANLKSSTLNSLSDQQKLLLLQFHVLPAYITIPQFQTVSNPLHTEAGDAYKERFPFNVTMDGNEVKISTGVMDASIRNTIYTDNQLAVYQVDKVLLPLNIFGPPAPVTAPIPEKGSPPSASDAPDSKDAPITDSSDAMGLPSHAVVSFAVTVIVSLFMITNS